MARSRDGRLMMAATLTPYDEVRAAIAVLLARPELVLTRVELAAPLMSWLDRQARYASTYDVAYRQEAAVTSAAMTFAREVNAAAAEVAQEAL